MSNAWEILLENLPFNPQEGELKQAFASFLHGPAFLDLIHDGKPFNFLIKLDPEPPCRKGSLVLPSAALCQWFMWLIEVRGGVGPIIRDCQLRISGTGRRANASDGNLVTKSPFKDPQVTIDRDNRRMMFQERIRVLRVDFGILCRRERIPGEPHVVTRFSSECYQDHRNLDSYLHFDDTEKDLRLSIGGHSERITQSIVLNIRSIQSIAEDGFYILFRLFTSAAYVTEATWRETTHSDRADRQKLRARRSALIHLAEKEEDDFLLPEHARVAPYASRVLRMHLHDYDDLENFRRMAKLAALPRIVMFNPATFESGSFGYYSKKALDDFASWIATLPWTMAFQCQALHSNLLLHTREILDLRLEIGDLIPHGIVRAAGILQHFGVVLQRNINDRTQLARPLFFDAVAEYDKAQSEMGIPKKLLPSEHMCGQATITPTAIRVSGPFLDRSNRVLRRYPAYQEYFIRVNFADEDLMHYRYEYEVDNVQYIYKRVKDHLVNGFNIGARHFQFLGYSSSALREHAVWFVAPFEDQLYGRMDAFTIRAQLGDFSRVICAPARYAARIAQTFSATEPSVRVTPSEWAKIDDIKYNGYIFTDGVGTVSPDLLGEIWQSLLKSRNASTPGVPPSAYQIRFGGCKGMIVVDPRLKGRKICIRRSMDKFDAPDSLDIEIAGSFERPLKMHLNRPLIMLLESNGVPASCFLELQEMAVETANLTIVTPVDFSSNLKRYDLGRSYGLSALTQDLVNRQILDFDDFHGKEREESLMGFLRRIAGFARCHILRDLKHHARIPVPGSYTLAGVADEHSYLEEGEVYICIQEPGEEPFWIEGPVLVSRSPAIHPGDAQFVTAVGKRLPPLDPEFSCHNLANLIVFSTQGSRDLPSCLGGGDLDGDLYNIIVSVDLHPMKTPEPGKYPKILDKTLNRQSEIADIADFVTNYIDSDVVGLVSTNHLIIADQADMSDPDCMKLAELHSQAVDYPKTGVPVDVKQIPRLKFPSKPDWNAGELRSANTTSYYDSQTAIGKLYRSIEVPEPPKVPIPTPTPLVPSSSSTVRPSPITEPQFRAPAQNYAWGRKKGPKAYEQNFPAPPGISPARKTSRTEFRIEQSPRVTAPPGLSLPPGLSAPPGLQTPSGLSFPPGLRVPTIPPVVRPTIDVFSRLQEFARPHTKTLPPSLNTKHVNIMRVAYSSYVISLQNLSVSHAIVEPLTEEELVAGTIMAKCSAARRRRELMTRMRELTGRLVRELRNVMAEDDIPHIERLNLAVAAWSIAAGDMEKHVWGAASFCLVALGVFCDTLAELETTGSV